jgi:amino acid transporter
VKRGNEVVVVVVVIIIIIIIIIIIVQTISKDINMNFGLEKYARICLKRGGVQSKMHRGNTFENDIKKTGPEEGI